MPPAAWRNLITHDIAVVKATDEILAALGIKLREKQYVEFAKVVDRVRQDLLSGDQAFRRYGRQNELISKRTLHAVETMERKYADLIAEGWDTKRAWKALPGKATEQLGIDESQLRRWRKKYLDDLPH